MSPHRAADEATGSLSFQIPCPREPLISASVLLPPKKAGLPGSAEVRGQGSLITFILWVAWKGLGKATKGLPVAPDGQASSHVPCTVVLLFVKPLLYQTAAPR